MGADSQHFALAPVVADGSARWPANDQIYDVMPSTRPQVRRCELEKFGGVLTYVLRLASMPILKVLTARALLEAAGFPESAIVAALAGGAFAAGHWVLCTPIGDEDVDARGSKFLKSIRKYVDDDEKRSNFLVMLTAISRAATQQDYGAVLANSTVTPKPAHSFSYQNKKHSVLELKQGKKDRIYFFAERFHGRPCIVLLLAHHKKDQTTPKDVCSHCEQAMKNCLATASNVEIK